MTHWDCHVCGSSWESPQSRGVHEARGHPDWRPSDQFRRERNRQSRRRWIEQQPKSAYFLGMSNVSAARYGLPPIPVDTILEDGPCRYCGGEAGGWDHVVPMGKGGAHDPSNLVPSCWPCNLRKQDTDLVMFRAVPGRVSLLCGWCWTPVVRRRDFLLRFVGGVGCSFSHANLIRRWGGRPFGDPLFAGPRTRLEPVA